MKKPELAPFLQWPRPLAFWLFQRPENACSSLWSCKHFHDFDDEETRKVIQHIASCLSPDGLLHFRCKSTSDPLYGKGEQVGKDLYCHKGQTRHFFSEDYVYALLHEWEVISVQEVTEEHQRITGEPVESSYIEVVARKPNVQQNNDSVYYSLH